ncbi:MAG: hydroxysqualene dehydroxylase HpnE [Nitrospirota bacterium]
MPSDRDVVIVGGGFAGLAAGVALAERGFRVTVVEKRSRLGGRASSYVDQTTGDVVDNGQHVFLRAYRETIRFLTTLGTLDQLAFQTRLSLDVVGSDGVSSRIAAARLPAPWHVAVGLLRASGLSWEERRSALALGMHLRRHGAADAVGLSVTQWLDRHQQPLALRTRLWHPLAIAALNETPDVAAASPFTTVLTNAFFQRASWSAVGIPRTGLGPLYTDAAQQFIEQREGRILTGQPASGLRVVRGRVTELLLGDGSALTASWFVSAIPYVNLSELLPSEVQLGHVQFLAAQGLVSSPIISLYLWFDRPVMDQPFVGLVGTTWQWVFNRRLLLGQLQNDGHVALVISAAHAFITRTTDELLDSALRDLRAHFPAARTAVLRHRVAIKEPHATFSPRVGSERFRPDQRTPLENFFLAGDWTRTGLPASIEGAVQSGYRCAELISRSS